MRILTLIIIIVTIVLLTLYFVRLVRLEVTYVKSSLDNRNYKVINNDDKEEAAYILSVIAQKIKKLREYLVINVKKYPEYGTYILLMNRRLGKVILSENEPNGRETSYTLNKGEEISLCLKSQKTGEFHDFNLIMYIVLHELSHVACPELQHTELFKKIFIFIIQVACDIGIYTYINYNINPHEYCGITITENLLNR